ncbi:creatininase family protein [Steroidobacter cummioxidans]|uniref:creatininase family protein n=1 Tax=Steroidobacter cummioxidans TaxID=1803913 RepID=UPI000E30B876|nr:creatininase family protein [Steroidobacter cummioxidans]
MNLAEKAGLLCAAMLLSAATNAAAPEAPRSMGGGNCAKSVYNCADTPNPLPKADIVWLEEMTWMDVRDAMARGSRTIIIPTGGVEPNGPWLSLGKHNVVLRSTCEAVARKLGNALCAPIIGFVPEGDIEKKTGHMDTVGTISVRQQTYEAIITDVAQSMQAHGFEHIVFISDNGGSNQDGQRRVAQQLNEQWSSARAYYIPEYYASWESADNLLLKKGLTKPGVRDGIHDDPASTLLMMQTDPATVRWEQRVKAGKTTIDGVSIADRQQALAWGRELLEQRASETAAAIAKALAARP